MPRNTRTNRRSSAKVPPEYSRSLMFDEMPHGGGARGEALEAWRRPAGDVMRGVIVCGQIKPRLCRVVPRSCAVAN
jgi:hypothetical protein